MKRTNLYKSHYLGLRVTTERVQCQQKTHGQTMELEPRRALCLWATQFVLLIQGHPIPKDMNTLISQQRVCVCTFVMAAFNVVSK